MYDPFWLISRLNTAYGYTLRELPQQSSCLTLFFSFQSKSQNKEKLNEKLAEIFAKIGSKENTREVCWIHFTLYNFAFAAFSFSMAQVGTSMGNDILLCG